MRTTSEIERYFHEQIPMSAMMGIRVESREAGSFVLTALAEPNHNHLGTAFGGSLAAIATLAGYGLLWLQFDGNAHIVIKSSALRYHHPVHGEIRATCRRPDEMVIAAFKARFDRKGKASIRLQVTVEEEDKVCVEFHGVYVAIR